MGNVLPVLGVQIRQEQSHGSGVVIRKNSLEPLVYFLADQNVSCLS